MAGNRENRNSATFDEQFAQLERLEAEYPATASLAYKLAEELQRQLEHLLADKQVSLSFPIQHRIKSWTSIVEKIERKSLTLVKLGDLEDLVGLRLILQFKRDVDAVRRLIRSKFEVVEEYDTQERLLDDRFGYSSVHFRVEPPRSWLELPTLSGVRGLRAEIQVRTTAQHIWAEASHLLQYKQEESIPRPIRRAINRVSVLLEFVDEEFESVLKQREAYRKVVTTLGPDEALNADLLEKTLDSLWPAANKASAGMPFGEGYAELLADLAHFGLTTPRALTEIIQKHREDILAMDRRMVTTLRGARDPHALGATPERLEKDAYMPHTAMTRLALEREFGNEWRVYQQSKTT